MSVTVCKTCWFTHSIYDGKSHSLLGVIRHVINVGLAGHFVTESNLVVFLRDERAMGQHPSVDNQTLWIQPVLTRMTSACTIQSSPREGNHCFSTGSEGRGAATKTCEEFGLAAHKAHMYRRWH